MSPTASKPWLTAEENSWWSATGKTSTGKTFAGALALAVSPSDPGGAATQFGVITGPSTMQLVPAANITAAARMAIVDAEWLDRADAQSDQITDAKVRLDGIKDICAAYPRDRVHPDAVAILEQIDPLITAKSKGGVRL